MSSDSPPGYACVVTQSWDPRALNVRLPDGMSPALKVDRGDEVFVFRIVRDETSLWVFTHRPTGRTHHRGWVPVDILEKGAQFVENPPIELPAASQTFGHGSSSSSRPSENVLQETLRDLWRSIKASEAALKNVIPGMSESSSDILFHRHAQQYGDLVYNCIDPQARAIMSTGKFNVEALGTLTQVSPRWPKQPGIYLILYYGFGGARSGNQTFQIAFYVGQTIQFQSRKAAHQQQAQTSNSIHYRLAKKASSMRMIPILLLPDTRLPDSFLDIAEFSMVCLFRSWHSILFKPSETSTVGAYATDFDACLAFSGLMKEVSDRTGWAPDRTFGLNWHTPILSSPRADCQWTSWYSKSDDMYIYRTRRTILRPGVTTEIYWQAERRVGIPTKVADEAGFRHGQPVHLVVEVKKRGGEYLTHPFRFVRYPPRIGLNTELERLRSLAIQVQWLDEQGQWKSYYLERQRTWTPMPNNGVPEIYRLALFILCNVEQTVYNNAPAWTLPTAPARINYLRYNHLQQKLVLEVRRPQHKNWPANNTITSNTQRLLQLFPGGPNADTVIGRRPGRDFLGSTRTACDLCMSQATTTRCQYNAATQTCQNCRCLNRPCTFSRSDRTLADDFLYGQPLEELGLAPHMGRDRASLVMDLEEAPFSPDIEAEEHADLAGN